MIIKETTWKYPIKLEIIKIYDPVIPFLGIYVTGKITHTYATVGVPEAPQLNCSQSSKSDPNIPSIVEKVWHIHRILAMKMNELQLHTI